MRRQLRWAFNLAAALSAVLFVGSLASAVADALYFHDTFFCGGRRFPTLTVYVSQALAFGTLAALSLHLRRRGRCGRPPGFCAACGYDLRATPGRCPECGAVPAAKGVDA